MKTLIIYFSASGVTKKVAEELSQLVEGDLFEIEPVERYTDADLDWRDQNSRSTIEMNNRDFRPAVSKKVENMGDYDKVVIGFPVWWYTAPTIINTFIEENNLSGKDVYIFVTSGGSGVDGSLKDLRAKYPEIKFVDGKRIQQVTDDLATWIS